MNTADALRKASNSLLHMVRVARDGSDRVYVELNDDRGVATPPEEAVVRVFLNRFDAERYKETVEHYQLLQPDQARVSTYGTLHDVFDTLAELDTKARQVFGCPIRIDLCEMPENEHPQSLAVLFTAYEERH